LEPFDQTLAAYYKAIGLVLILAELAMAVSLISGELELASILVGVALALILVELEEGIEMDFEQGMVVD
jgi:uncharacterized membrane protein